MKLTLLLIVFSINLAWAQSTPECQENSWFIKNIAYSASRNISCDGDLAVCNYIGSSDEGWYSYPLDNKEMVIWDKCSVKRSDKPKCLAIGSKSEGWYYHGQLINWAQCASLDVVCIYEGGRSEGWYSFPAGTRYLINLATCYE